jgi:hypothetical protein
MNEDLMSNVLMLFFSHDANDSQMRDQISSRESAANDKTCCVASIKSYRRKILQIVDV